MPFYKIKYSGFVVIESESIEEAVKDMHEYKAIYDKEKIDSYEEMDPVDVLDLTGVQIHDPEN